MSRRYIVLGNGRRVTLGSYASAWRAVKAMPPHAKTRANPDDPDEWHTAADALEAYRSAMHRRIAARGDMDGYGMRVRKGRKWADEWQIACARLAYHVNNRARVRPSDVPPEYVKRLAHKLR